MKFIKFKLLIAFMLGCMNAWGMSGVTITLAKEDSINYIFNIHNDTQDTLYLLNSYLVPINGFSFKKNDGTIVQRLPYYSYLFHRYDKSVNTYKLSLIPIVRELGVAGMLHDVIRMNEDRYIRFHQIGYFFTPLAPESNYMLSMEKEAFHSTDYIKDIHIESPENRYKSLSDAERVDIKSKPKSVILELAVYKDIHHIAPFSEIVDPDIRDKQGGAFGIISLAIPLEPSEGQETGYCTD